MLKHLFSLVMWLAVGALIMCQTDELGVMLAVDFHGLIYAMIVCFGMAILEAVYLGFCYDR